MSERGRRAVTSFCEPFMLRKEAAERVRGTSFPRGPAGKGAVVAVDALGPPRFPVGFKISALVSPGPRDRQASRLGIRTALHGSPGDGVRCDMAAH